MVYEYRPESLRSLFYLVDWQVNGANAIYNEMVGDLTWIMACDKKANENVTKPYSQRLKDIYKSPFANHIAEEDTGEDIINHLLQR